MFFIVDFKRRVIISKGIETRDEAQALLTSFLTRVRQENRSTTPSYQIVQADTVEEIEDDLAIY